MILIRSSSKKLYVHWYLTWLNLTYQAWLRYLHPFGMVWGSVRSWLSSHLHDSPSWSFPVCLEFAGSPCAVLGSLEWLQIPPTVKRCAVMWIGFTQLLTVCEYVWICECAWWWTGHSHLLHAASSKSTLSENRINLRRIYIGKVWHLLLDR